MRPRDCLLLTVATLACLAPGLGTIPLAETSEGRYASIAASMVDSGDWVVPRYDGQPHLEKPPLTYWLVAASIRFFGRTELAVRLPCLLAAIGLVLACAWLGSALFGRATGLLAAAMLIGSIEFAGLERFLATDPFLALATAGAVCASWAGLSSEGDRRRRAFLLFQVSLAAGVLAKGPLGLLWPLSAVVPAFAASGRLVLLPRMRWPIGLALVAGTSGAWLWALDSVLPGAARYMVLDRIFAAARDAKGYHEGPWWFYLAVLPAGFFPWVLLAPEVVLRLRSSAPREGTERAARGLLVGWVVVPLVLLSLSRSKLPSYVFPMFPALAILAAWGVGEAARGAIRVSLAAAAALGAIGAAALLWPAEGLASVGDLVDHRGLVAVPAFAGAALAVLALLALHGAWRIVGTAAAMAVLAAGAAWNAAGVADDLFSSRRIAERLSREARPGDCIVFYKDNPSGIPFYTGRRAILIGYAKLKTPASLVDDQEEARYWNRDDPGEIRTLLDGSRRVLGVAKVEDYDRIVRKGVPVREVMRTARQVLFTGR